MSKNQEYMRPVGLELATQLVDDNTDALIVNGATDLGLKVTKNNELLPKLIDVSDIPKLKEIKVEKDGVYYGAGLNLEDLRQHCKDYFPALYDMLSVFGSRQIRYMGTLGGNIASASPIGDVPPVMMAYDAVYSLVSIEGERNVKARDFVTGYRETRLKPNELIKGAFIPFLKNNRTVKSYKISKRKDLDISTVSAGFQLDLDNKKVQDIALVYGGMAAMTQRAEKAESYLRGKLWERKHVEKAMKLINEDFTPISDARSGAEGRRVMARNLLLKLWNETQYDS
jgi:xanthine dehydrogenase iron-sulfur cluster and FAD-binding subunit A